MRKKSCFFISAGNNSLLCNHILNKKIILNNFDLIINFYGDDNSYFKKIANVSTHIEKNKTTKFIALKKMYDSSKIKDYECVFVFDDDAILIKGNFLRLQNLMLNYKLSMISPSHSKHGKISYKEHETKEGNHIFRYVNFIEMNFPVFSRKSLASYMNVYDGSLCGYGNDWWYLNAIQADKKECCAICDDVIIENPQHHKKNKSNCIDSFMSLKKRQEEFVEVFKKQNLKTWEVKTTKYIYKKDNHENKK